MDGCLQTVKPSRYVTDYPGQLLNSAFHPPEAGKSNTNLPAWLGLRRVRCVGWQVTLCTWTVTYGRWRSV